MDGDSDSIARMYKDRAHWLQVEINTLHRQSGDLWEQVESLRKDKTSLRSENTKLTQRIAELTGKASPPAREPPAFVKPNVADRPRRKPGRAAGHAAALRRRPSKIDVKQDVALPKDGRGKSSCPHCRTQLSEVKHHRLRNNRSLPSMRSSKGVSD